MGLSMRGWWPGEPARSVEPQTASRPGPLARLWRWLRGAGPAPATPSVAAPTVTAPGHETAPDVARRLERVRRAVPAPASSPSGPAAEADALTWADVERLAADRSTESRAILATRFGRRFGAVAAATDQELSHAVLDLLVRDVAIEVRRSLAEAVAASADLPRAAALRLASDDIAVARPLLEHSPVLSDPDLIDIVRTSTMQHALAIAGRGTVSEELSSELAATGDSAVAARLVGNAGAAISRQTLESLIADHGGNESVRHGLVQRPDLPFELVEKLVGAVGKGLVDELVADEHVDPARARQLLEAVRFQSTVGLVARTHRAPRSLASLRERFAAGELRHEDLIGALRSGDVDMLEQGIALHADVGRDIVRRALYSADRRQLAALCAKAGFGVTDYITLRAAIQAAEDGVALAAVIEPPSADQIRWLERQYASLRRDPATVELLLRG